MNASTLDLHDIPLIDEHVHIFAPDADQPSFDPLATFTLGGDDPGFLETEGRTLSDQERDSLQVNLTQTIAYQQAIRDLADFLGCAPTRDDILTARAEHMTDFRGYVRKLYRDINLESMIIDLGHPRGASLDAFGALTGVPAYGIYRIEPLIGDLWDEHADFTAFDRAYLDAIHDQKRDSRIVSLKSIIAYRTGLAIEPVTPAEAERAFATLKASSEAAGLLGRVHVPHDLFATVKSLRDFLLWQAFELSIELALPFQIHTGMGDQDLEIRTARPGLMSAVFRDPKLRHARIVMLHGSYPFHQEAAYLTNIFPNVYLDLSEFNPFIGKSGVRRVLQAILDLAPFTKLLYASDAYGSPELQWVAGRNARAGLESILVEAIDDGMLTPGAARQAARLIFADNARALYSLQ